MQAERRAKLAWAMLRRSSFYVKTDKNIKKIFYLFLPIFSFFAPQGHKTYQVIFLQLLKQRITRISRIFRSMKQKYNL